MTLQTQWLALAVMFASGLLLGICLDLYRVLKGQWHLTGWVVALVDLCYWIVAGGFVFSVLLWSTWGELRFYMLLFLFAGIGVYYLWFSRPAIAAILLAIRVVQALIRFIITILRLLIWTPIMYIGLFCFAVVKIMGRFLWVILRGIGWLLRPIWRPLIPLLEPIYLPLTTWLTKFFRLVAGIWQKVKNVLIRKK